MRAAPGYHPTSAFLLAATLMLGVVPGALRSEMSGDVLIGWRDVDVDGDREKYRQHVNLRGGAWLQELELAWQDPDTAARPPDGWRPDTVRLQLTDLGGEPYERSRLELGRQGKYRLTYDRLSSEYVYDDVLVRPQDASVSGSTGGDFRRFDFERVRDQVSLAVNVSPSTEVALAYHRSRKHGDGTAPVEVSREEFVVARPIDETMDTVEASIAHARERFSVTWTERYRRFDFDSTLFLPEFSEGSNPAAPTALETFVLEQPYTLDGFEHELTLRYRPTSRLSLTGQAVLADVDVNLRARETASGTDFAGAPLDTSLLGAGDLDQDRRLLDVGATFAVSERVELFARARHVTFDQTAALDFDPDGAADWNIDGWRLEAGAQAAFGRALRVAAGATAERREVTARQTVAEIAQRAQRDTDADGYFIRAWYRPSRRSELHVSWEDDSIDDPFTLASPTATSRLRLRGRYRWDNGFAVTASYLATDRRNARSGWQADAERLDLRAGFTGTRLAISAGLGRTDLARSVDSLVIAGTREVLFDIDYLARADTLDVMASWKLTGDVSLGGSYRRFANGRSFDVDRDDWRVFVHGRLADRYRWRLEHRRTEFSEGDIEDFQARVLELSFGLAW